MSVELQENIKLKIKKPKQYGVYLLNDDYTTFDFVIFICQKVFQKNKEEGLEIALTIHKDKKALAGIYSKEIAELKCKLVEDYAEQEGFPFSATVSEID